ncbi:helix-hairpin-helix domain-containing protein [Aureibacillus halotolerans]|uniref:Competence protein ComEA n=1 Tax=Aureibacillus halotolerans TaxID=1508390 RepID=A0A4V3D4Y9_9BACI|nr:helix-hairpin-helix domain-containing protein [Aureibacillus halotolerans]TDQ38037.1 competence protein ComEA [Aureibacillus halotolerans]
MIKKKWKTVAAVLAVLVVVAILFVIKTPLLKQTQSVDQIGDWSTDTSEEHAIKEPGQVVVDVKGAVKQPGIYQLTAKQRVKDAIEKAGGLTEEASTGSVNLAKRLEDELVIVIPGKESSGEIGKTGGQVFDPVLNILNEADVIAMEEWPGIGPKKAEAILAYRDEKGSFSSIEELKDVSGIGEKTYEKIIEAIGAGE